MRKIRGDHVVRVLGAGKFKNCTFIIMEEANGGSLHKF